MTKDRDDQMERERSAMDDRDALLQAALDAGGPPDRSDPELLAYWRVRDAIRDVRPALSDNFAARVARRAFSGRLRPSSWSTLVPVMTSSLALAVAVGAVSLLESLGYIEGAPLMALGFLSDIPMAMVMATAALFALLLVDAVISERDVLLKGRAQR